MIEKIKNYKFFGEIVITLISSIVTVTLTVYITYNNLINEHDKLYNLININTYTSLRNLIWNDKIPLNDRIKGCDDYLEQGYNSETKKYCEYLVNKEVSNYEQ